MKRIKLSSILSLSYLENFDLRLGGDRNPSEKPCQFHSLLKSFKERIKLGSIHYLSYLEKNKTTGVTVTTFQSKEWNSMKLLAYTGLKQGTVSTVTLKERTELG